MIKIIKNNSFLLLLLIPLLLILVLVCLFKEQYLNCMTKDFFLCIKSKKYVSSVRRFAFRYPNDYPITYKTGDELKTQYLSDFNSIEWVNFSSEFYPEAGGNRLGSIIVEKNTPYKNIKEYANKELSNFEVPMKIEFVKIDGKDAVCSSLKPQIYTFTIQRDTCYLFYKKELYQIAFDYDDYYHKFPVEDYKKAKELILSTFTLN